MPECLYELSDFLILSCVAVRLNYSWSGLAALKSKLLSGLLKTSDPLSDMELKMQLQTGRPELQLDLAKCAVKHLIGPLFSLLVK